MRYVFAIFLFIFLLITIKVLLFCIFAKKGVPIQTPLRNLNLKLKSTCMIYLILF